MFWVIIWILLFMFLVFIHECWHFWTAKKAWVKVKEFWIWIPPKAKSLFTDTSWTEYTLNWIPLWWFVRLKWEDPDGDDFLDTDSFVSASLPWKLIILAWWVIMNLLFAWIAFSSAFMVWVKPITVLPEWMTSVVSSSYLMPTASFLQEQWFLSGDIQDIPVVLQDVLQDSLASEAWFSSWDVLSTIDLLPVDTWNIWSLLKDRIWSSFSVILVRDWTEIEKTITCPDDQCLLWIVMASWWNQELLPIKMWFSDAIHAWWTEIAAQTELTFSTLWSLWRNLFSFNREKISWSVEKLSWPVGIVHVWSSILEHGWWVMYLAFWWMISLALALFNILPFPALDGWRALSVLIQQAFWFSPTSYYKIEAYVNFFFFALLMLLWIYIIFQDIWRIVGV